jgi:hypothetical protein
MVVVPFPTHLLTLHMHPRLHAVFTAATGSCWGWSLPSLQQKVTPRSARRMVRPTPPLSLSHVTYCVHQHTTCPTRLQLVGVPLCKSIPPCRVHVVPLAVLDDLHFIGWLYRPIQHERTSPFG